MFGPLGDLKVSAIRSTHIAGHASYRVDTPAGSVVIGGDAGNDVPAPPRSSSTSEQVEKLAKGADVIVHSAIHPIMGPDKGSGMFPYAYLRQSSVPDLAAMAQRAGAKHLMLTHLIPPIGADQQYPFKVPGGPLTEADYRRAAQDGGLYWKYHRGHRSRQYSPAREINLVQTGRFPSWVKGSGSGLSGPWVLHPQHPVSRPSGAALRRLLGAQLAD